MPPPGPWVAYALRMALAGTFLLAGLDHASAPGGLAWAVAFMPNPAFWGWLLAYAELAAGIGLALGLLMPLSLFVVGLVGVGATTVVFLDNGAFLWQNLAMAAAAVYVLAHGNGPAALDDRLAARWPALRRWLLPLAGSARAPGLALQGLRVTLGVVLLLTPLLAIAQGVWTSTGAARVAPFLGLLVFLLRPLVGALLLAGAAPRATAGLLVVLAVIGLVPSRGLDYHHYIVLGTAAALLLAPAGFRGPAWLRPPGREGAQAGASGALSGEQPS